MPLTQTIEYDSLTVEHRINPRMKHCYVVVEHGGKVVLKTPRITRTEALGILQRRSQWIQRKLLEQQSMTLLAYTMGEEVLYFGECHTLEGNDSFDDLTGALGRLCEKNDKSLRRCYDTFYKNRTADYLGERLAHYEEVTGLRAEAMQVRKMRRRWGSCSSRGVITFNSRITQLPPEVIDYIVVHELAHLRHMDHSRAFYLLVAKTMPQYKRLQRQLRGLRLT